MTKTYHGSPVIGNWLLARNVNFQLPRILLLATWPLHRFRPSHQPLVGPQLICTCVFFTAPTRNRLATNKAAVYSLISRSNHEQARVINHILVADDYEPWRNQVRLLLLMRPEWQITCEVSDGLEAVQKAQELEPDLIVLDIGLPKLNGIEAARRIRELSPDSKIVFLSMDNSLDTVQAALSTGAQGFVHKARAQSELLPAIDTVLRGGQFVSSTSRG